MISLCLQKTPMSILNEKVDKEINIEVTCLGSPGVGNTFLAKATVDGHVSWTKLDSLIYVYSVSLLLCRTFKLVLWSRFRMLA